MEPIGGEGQHARYNRIHRRGVDTIISRTLRAIQHPNSATLDFAPCIQLLRKLFWALRSSVHDYAMAIQDRGPQVEAVAITFLILSWIAVSLRCYVKFYMLKLFKIDDWFAVLSLVWLVHFRNWIKLTARWVSFTFFCTVVLAGEKMGTGRHIQDIPKEDFSVAMMVRIHIHLIKVYRGSNSPSGGFVARFRTLQLLPW